MGNGWRINADGFRAGRTALKKISLFDASRYRVDRSGEVDLPAQLPPGHCLTRRQVARLERGVKLLLHAAMEAWGQAGLAAERCSEPIPICLGTSAGAMAVGEDYYRQAVQRPARHAGQLTRIRQYQIQTQALLLAEALGVSGSLTIVSNACASGANSIGHAFEQLHEGRAGVAIAGGYDALCEMVFAGFDSLQALSTTQPRPFDADRDGLALGEGAGVFILETFEHAAARGAEVLGELCGYGAATDLHHLTQPHPDGDAALRSMTRACEVAGLSPSQIGYINSHGTGTPLNDVAEARAIVRWAGEHAASIAVSSTKAAIGHLLGGAGSVEAVICLMALREGWLPPTIGIQTPDASCRFDLVRTPRNQAVDFALTNSFGFGGANATLIFGKSAAENRTRLQAAAARGPERPVCIRGIGAVSPAGWSALELADCVLGGVPVASPVVTRTVGALPVAMRTVPPAPPLACLRESRMRRVSPISRFAVAAAFEALGEERRAAVKAGSLRLGIVFSIANGCVSYSRRFYAEVLANPEMASPILFPETVFNAPSSHLGTLLGTSEINYTLVGDSSGFSAALRVASNWLEERRVDGALVVCAEECDWVSCEAAVLHDHRLILSEGAAAVYLETGGSECRIQRHPPDQLYSAAFPMQVAAETVAGQLFPDMTGNCVLCDGETGAALSDAAESAAWRMWLGARLSARRILGEGLGASVGWQTVLAVEALRRGLHDRACVSAVGPIQQAGGFLLCQGGGSSV